MRPVVRPDYVAADLLPPRLLSASDCVCPRCPDVWAVRWVQRSEAERRAGAGASGIAPERVEAVVEWVTRGLDAGTVGWPGVFLALASAYEFAVRFLPPGADVALLGLGLPEPWAMTFLAEEAPRGREGASGLYMAVQRGTPPAAGGAPLGYELLGYDGFGGVHSWLCNGLEREVAGALGVRPNAAGLLATLGDAERAAAHITRDDVDAEPAWWAPWHLTRYPLPADDRRVQNVEGS